MRHCSCQRCGYDLTGLSGSGACPECGRRFDAGAVGPRSDDDDPHPLWRHGKWLALSVLAVVILLCGGALTIRAQSRGLMLVLTLVAAAVPVFGAWVYWRAQRESPD